MSLRDYQSRCVDAIFSEWQKHLGTLVLAATGSGKTVIFAEVIRRMQPARTLVLAERREIIFQARDKIEQWAQLPCEIEMAHMSANTSLFHRTPVVIATIQTLRSGKDIKRLHRFNPDDFGLVVIDECHHSAAESYTKVIEYFRRNPKIRVLGVTATGDRADGQKLGHIFGSTAFKYDILDAVGEGWLVDVTQQFCRVTSLDFSHIKTIAGDLAQNELAAVMEAEKNIQGVCQPSLEVMFGLEPRTLSQVEPVKWGEFLSSKVSVERGIPRRSIMFTASVAQAEMCCNIFNRVIPNIAEWVCGKTDPEERKSMLQRFRKGHTAIVMNCGVLTEGFDDPGVHIIFMARPTKSRSLYTQMVGRSTRPLPGLVDGLASVEERLRAIAGSPKPFCRIVDYVGNSGRHKLVTALDILSGGRKETVITRTMADALKTGVPFRVCRKLNATEADMVKEAKAAALKRQQNEEARRVKLYARSDYTQRAVDAFGHGGTGPAQHWLPRMGKPLSEGMRKVLLKRGYNPDRFSFQQARAIIGKIAEKEGWNKKQEPLKGTNEQV